MKYSVIPLRHTIPLLGSSLLILSACATTPAFSKEKTVTAATSTTANPRPTKTYQDGSAPFTMLEIEERLLRVFALPPAQINRAAVEKIFGVVFVGDEKQGNGGFAESISKDCQVEFTINVFRVSTRGLIFNYDVQVKTIRSDGLHIMDGHPDSIPAAYKSAILPLCRSCKRWAGKRMASTTI